MIFPGREEVNLAKCFAFELESLRRKGTITPRFQAKEKVNGG